MVDRQQQICRERVGAGHARIEARVRPAISTHENGLCKAGIAESLIDLPREPQIEIKFVDATCAFGAGRLRGVADVEHDTKIRDTRSSPRVFSQGSRAVGADNAKRQHGQDSRERYHCGAPGASHSAKVIMHSVTFPALKQLHLWMWLAPSLILLRSSATTQSRRAGFWRFI